MENFDKNKLSLYNSIVALLLQNKPVLNEMKNLLYPALELSRITKAIRKKEWLIKSDIGQKLLHRVKVKDDLVYWTSIIAASLHELACSMHDEQLKVRTKISEKSLFRLEGRQLVNAGYQIYELAKKNYLYLRSRQIPQSHLKTLKNRIEAYSAMFSDDCVNNIYPINHNLIEIDGLFEEAAQVLAVIDNYLEVLRKSYSGFYQRYQALRSKEKNLINTMAG